MGNTHSDQRHPPPPPPQVPAFRRRRSAIFSRLSICKSAIPAICSDPAQATSITEKESFLELDEQTTPSTYHFAYVPVQRLSSQTLQQAYAVFLADFPEYRLTWTLDSLRRTDYERVDRSGETYVDYMGGCLYPASLVRFHGNFLNNHVFGNTHSVSNSSKLSKKYADEARDTVLAFFDAPSEYTVVFTSNASGALKLIGESFPFTSDSTYVLGNDSHNSVHGIREFAVRQGARVGYIPSTPTGGVDLVTAKISLIHNRPQSGACLFALTAQSNITNTKNPLSLLDFAGSLGYYTLLDAAALVPTSSFSLKKTSVDAMAISFYKMFGYPTGVGALIIKKRFLEALRRPWFAGGTVDVVQVPGSIVTYSSELHEQFEDGTINYLSLPAISEGLRLLSGYLPFLPLRLTCLMHYLTTALSRLRHDSSGTPVVRILSQLPDQRIRHVGDQTGAFGSTVSLLFLSPSGKLIPNSFIEYSAAQKKISLRTGCMCNPGGAATLLEITEDMKRLYPGVTLTDFERYVGRELGVVRISLGLASNFQDVWNCVQFARMIASEKQRRALWDRWTENSGKMVE